MPWSDLHVHVFTLCDEIAAGSGFAASPLKSPRLQRSGAALHVMCRAGGGILIPETERPFTRAPGVSGAPRRFFGLARDLVQLATLW